MLRNEARSLPDGSAAHVLLELQILAKSLCEAVDR